MTITITFFWLACIVLAISFILKVLGRGNPDWPQYLLGVSLVLAVLALHGG